MDEFPDPEDEYDLLHEDEMDVLREMEQMNPIPKSAPSRQNLDFNSCKGESSGIDIGVDDDDDDDEEGDLVIDLAADACLDGKRQLSVESLNDTGIEQICIEPPSKRYKCEASKAGDFDFNLHYGTTSLKLPRWPFFTFNTYDGERFYVKFKEDATENVANEYYCEKFKNKFRLLGESFSNVKAMAEKSLQECEARNNLNEENPDVLLNEEISDLWVEKYKPRRYLELLSDEGVNRSLLNWLKMWDKFVFNKPEPQTLQNSGVNEDRNKKFHIDNIMKFNNESMDKFDADGRPHYKIALLCGPPGLGKTTLAHVIANLAGYNVIEINASDDRSTEAFHSKLVESTQTLSAFGSKKPNCIILDEIDGAPTTSIEYLLKCVHGKTSQKGGKKERAKALVKRPVICICNEPYVPALRQLRQKAYVVHFPHTSSSRLAQRLLEICRKQYIKTDLSTLTLLCDKMQNDIRCCISTLHFFKRRNGHTFKPSDILKFSVGQKDLQKGLFSMWQEIFQIPMKKNRFLNGPSEKSDVTSSHFHYSPKNMDRLKYLVQLFQSSGDYERLQEGIYENFPKMKFSRTLSAMVSGLDWFCWTDIINTFVKEHQSYVLLPYLPYSFAAWHFLYSSPGFNKITFPKTKYENYLKEVRTEQIISDVLRGLNPGIRANTDAHQLILDILPMFKTILVPPLRSINLKLFTDREKKDFDHLINVMIDYNLNYIQQRSIDGTYYYLFDPNIEDITQFSEMERNKLSFSYSMKQFISREVEMERVRRLETSIEDCEMKESSVQDAQKKVSCDAKVPNNPQKQNSKKVKMDNSDGAMYKDFFGRIVTVKAVEKRNESRRRNDSYKSNVWFTYKEGFNNAVKKDVTIDYLL